MNIWRFLEGGCIFNQSQGNFKGSIPFHSCIDELSLLCTKWQAAGQSCGSGVCLSLRMLNTHLVCLCCPAQPAEDRDVNQQALSLFSSGWTAPPLLVMPGDQAANLALSQSCSAYWRVKGKAQLPSGIWGWAVSWSAEPAGCPPRLRASIHLDK